VARSEGGEGTGSLGDTASASKTPSTGQSHRALLLAESVGSHDPEAVVGQDKDAERGPLRDRSPPMEPASSEVELSRLDGPVSPASPTSHPVHTDPTSDESFFAAVLSAFKTPPIIATFIGISVGLIRPLSDALFTGSGFLSGFGRALASIAEVGIALQVFVSYSFILLFFATSSQSILSSLNLSFSKIVS